MSAIHQDYPQDISPDESELKFGRFLIDGIVPLIGSGIFPPEPVPVVARILSSSDVVVKIYDLRGGVAYSHRRWGYSRKHGRSSSCAWFPLDKPMKDVKQLFFDFSFGVHPETFRGDIVGVKFKYRAG
ncbi:MAG: hypothetical protein ACLP2Y_08905 [Limisphaerales bacterium]